MATLSNWRAYYERNYETAVGSPMKKEVKELSQLYSKGRTYPMGYYQLYPWNNIPYINTVSDGYAYVNAYHPGDIYLSDAFYTIFDMFTSDELAEIETECREAFTKYSRDGITIVKMPKKIFWQGPDQETEGDGVFFVPYISCSINKISNPNRFDGNGFISFGTFATAFNPRYISWNLNQLMYNGQPLSYGTDYVSTGGDLPRYNGGAGGDFETYVINGYASDYNKAVDVFLNVIKKVKFYPFFGLQLKLWREVKDGIVYGAANSFTTPTVGPSNNFVTFAYILDDVPYAPINGFTGSQSSWSPQYNQFGAPRHGMIVKVSTEGGPDPKDPDEKDDPNDDDDPPKPDDDGGDGDHDNTTDPVPPPGPPVISASGVGLLTIFNPTSSQLAALGTQLWNPTVLQALKQFFTEPTDAIIGLGIIPVQPRTGSSKNIHLGIYDTKVTAPMVDSDYVIKDCGSIPITRYYGSYLDYDPYTKISLYLPYIGEIDIDPDQVMQTNLGVEYHINVVTGDAVAIVTSNGSVIYTASGNCMRQIPIAQKDFSAIINTAVAAVSTIATAGVSAGAAKAVGGAVAGASKSEAGKAVADARTNAQLKNMEMGAGSSLIDQVMSSKFKYKHAGDIGGGAGQLAVQSPYLTIERPNLMLANNYKSYVGYPCNATLQLNRCKGFTQIEATRLSIAGATDEEITEALSYLVEGVII